MQDLQLKADKLRAQLKDLHEQHATGFVTDQQFADFSAYLERRLAEVEAEVAELAERTVPVLPPPVAAPVATQATAPAPAGDGRRRVIWAVAGAVVILGVLAVAAVLHVGRPIPEAGAPADPVAKAESEAGLVDGPGAQAPAAITDATAPTTATATQALPGAAAAPASGAVPAAPMSATDAAAGISGVVTLSPALLGKVQPEDTLFVFARAVNGPPMPLAVIRKQVKDLPLRFRLDDSQAVWPQAKVSGFGQVVVTARISKSGEGQAQPGDLQGHSATVAAGVSGLQIEIASVVGP